MRAAVFHGPGQPWTVEDLPDPTPGSGEMVVQVARCGICGSDVHMTSGDGYSASPHSVLGHEYAGEVVAVGKDVTGFRLGDRVAAMPFSGCGSCELCRAGEQALCLQRPRAYTGGFAEYTLVAASTTIKLPHSLSLADGALVEPMAVGLHGVKLAGPLHGKRAVVYGVGAIGLGVIRSLRAEGATRIVAVARSERRREIALSMGADAHVTTGENDRQRIADALCGQPDLVFECVGSQGALDSCIRLIRPNGTVVSLGYCVEPDPLSVVRATRKQARLIFSFGYTLPEFAAAANQLDANPGDAKAMITETIGLGNVGGAIERLRAGYSGVKVHVDPVAT